MSFPLCGRCVYLSPKFFKNIKRYLRSGQALGILIQQHSGHHRPNAYGSQSLTWSCNKRLRYLFAIRGSSRSNSRVNWSLCVLNSCLTSTSLMWVRPYFWLETSTICMLLKWPVKYFFFSLMYIYIYHCNILNCYFSSMSQKTETSMTAIHLFRIFLVSLWSPLNSVVYRIVNAWVQPLTWQIIYIQL